MSASSRNPRSAGRSSTARGNAAPEPSTMPSPKDLRYLDPCAATASMFLYAQGSSVVCCHHDTLTIDRRFSRHSAEVELLAIDNHSENGAGRLVVSYDASQTAIVWDLMTGDEIARFVSFDHLTSVAWMKNGNVAFGNIKGNIILFEPTTSEHESRRTLDQLAVTALAPAADCTTFAIGYQNGSLLIAKLEPAFSILYNLSTSRAPSPIISVSWHASSPRQKADMLAVQTHDSDLRVWSITRKKTDDGAKVVRILRRSESLHPGPNWMGWSKNGRVIQFFDNETLSWDVRTKHVTFDSIPTLEHVRGMTVYGPGATLFTIGPNGTVQQFDLNAPSIMVANVQHPVSLLPPSPPNSIEEQANRSVHSTTTIHTSESESSSIPLELSVSESDEDHMSPYDRIARHQGPDNGHAAYDTSSPVSSRSGMSSISKSSAGSRTPGRNHGSLRSRAMTENTYISAGTSIKSSAVGAPDNDHYSMGYSLGTTSVSSMASSRSRHRPSRLRHEVPRSPDDSQMVHDLFKYTRTRLSDMAYRSPNVTDGTRLTNDDLRRQMLLTIFGWQNEIEDLIRDEMSRQPTTSTSRILLSKWLGDTETDMMPAAAAQNMTSSDWMLLALSGIGSHSSQQKLGRVYVQRLLESGDIHVAVTIMLGMGDQNDAIEIYISHKRYMEALILACLSFPGVWERQAAIVRKWGEWAVQHGQQQLAIRCFACTDQEPTEAWRSPSAVQLNFVNTGTPSIPEILSPPLSPPGQRGPQRSVAKTSALRLITSFGDQDQKSKFYSENGGGATPIAAGVTPIAESAVSPGANEATTAFIRPSNNSRFNTPTSARPSGRGRLPSIGEVTSGFDREEVISASKRGHSRRGSNAQDNLAAGNALHRAATASPMMMRDNFKKSSAGYDGHRPPSPDRHLMARMQEAHANRRNGSRDRIPQGVSMQLQSLEPTQIDTASTEQSAASSTRFHWPSRRRGPGSVASSVTSASSAGRSYRHGARGKLDHINSLDAAKEYSRRSRSRHASKERAGDGSRARPESKERKPNPRGSSQDRGRASARQWTQPRRSPTSPIPMSPEDLANLGTPKYFEMAEPATLRKVSGSKTKSRTSSKGSNRRSPDGRRKLPPIDTRSRSKGSDGRGLRSPTSPVPLSASALHYQGSEDEEDYKRAMMDREAFRAKHSRSTSRGLASPANARHERSQSRQREPASETIEILPPPSITTARSRAASTAGEHAGDLRRQGDDRQRRKELAALELEERRKSLAKRAETPKILHPDSYAPSPYMRVGVEAADERSRDDLPPRSATEPPQNMYAKTGPSIGLPATPKAMRLIMESGNRRDQPEVPEIPATFAEKHIVETSPKQEKAEEVDESSSLFLLPSTVYQPPEPGRANIPRSMSAPIPDELPHHSRHGRKNSVAEPSQTIDEIVQSDAYYRKDDGIPSPLPTAPPLLKELQHLAIPPPPPPAPLAYSRVSNSTVGPLTPGVEIVMDDEIPMAAAPYDGMVPVLSPPAPRPRHSRGRSTSEISRVGQYTSEKLRSASRPRMMRSPSVGADHIRSPVMSPPPVMYDQDAIRSPIEPPSNHASTGLHRSEMI